ncbi:hypothetical protein CPB84DRAFT_1801506, partial [Gymnopilus junonius]
SLPETFHPPSAMALQFLQQLLLRWSDINRQIPGVIVLAGTESDVITAITIAVENKIPFVPCSGGHSLWSTIGQEGFILDLRLLTNISVNVELRQVTLQSGVLVKQANDVAWEHGLCLPLGTANTAGVVPMALGGGLSTFSGIMGFASDNIVSAKLVTADGQLVTASSTSHPDLLYGLRGAGQFLVWRTLLLSSEHPTEAFGQELWYSPLQKLRLYFNFVYANHGICIITSPPPTFTTTLVIIPVFFGEAADAERFYEPLISLGPFSTCQNGGFKQFSGAAIIARYDELTSECPDARTSGYAVEWNTYDTEFLSWYSDPASHEAVSRAEQDVISLARRGQEDSEFRSYQNWSRDGPIEYMYSGKARQDRLRALKQTWDPAGVFTRLFLE